MVVYYAILYLGSGEIVVIGTFADFCRLYIGSSKILVMKGCAIDSETSVDNLYNSKYAHMKSRLLCGLGIGAFAMSKFSRVFFLLQPFNTWSVL